MNSLGFIELKKTYINLFSSINQSYLEWTHHMITVGMYQLLKHQRFEVDQRLW